MSLVKRLRDRTHVSQQFEDEAADRIEELEKGWISIKDQPPLVPCLTYWDDNTYEAYSKHEQYALDDFLLNNPEARVEDVKLTHWQPLPSPPEQDNDLD